MHPRHKVLVRLDDDQRAALKRIVHTGTHPAAMRRRAHILLKTDINGPDAWADERIAQALDTTRMTVQRVRQQCAAHGTTITREPTRLIATRS